MLPGLGERNGCAHHFGAIDQRFPVPPFIFPSQEASPPRARGYWLGKKGGDGAKGGAVGGVFSGGEGDLRGSRGLRQALTALCRDVLISCPRPNRMIRFSTAAPLGSSPSHYCSSTRETTGSEPGVRNAALWSWSDALLPAVGIARSRAPRPALCFCAGGGTPRRPAQRQPR